MADQTAHQQGKQEALKDKKHFIVEYFFEVMCHASNRFSMFLSFF